MNIEKISRKEVMDHLDKEIMKAIPLYLKPIEKNMAAYGFFT